jgi:hypothetical protein
MRASLVAVLLLALLPAWAHAATPSTIGYRGDASHDNRITGAPDAPLGVLWATDLGAPMSYRERRPDAWGRAYAIDPICGKRRLPVPQGRAFHAPDASARLTRAGW